MKLAHVVNSYNRPDAFLDQVSWSKEMPFDLRVAVTCGRVPFPDLRADGWVHLHLAGTRTTVGCGRNMALALAHRALGGEAVSLMVDDDILLRRDALDACFAKMQERRDLGLLLPVPMWGPYAYQMRERGIDLMSIPIPNSVVFIDHAVPAKIGYHDPRLIWAEDTDYALRSRAAGFDPSVYSFDEPRIARKAVHVTRKSFVGGFGVSFQGDGRDRRREYRISAYEYLGRKYPWARVTNGGDTFCWRKEFKNLHPDDQVAQMEHERSVLDDAALDAVLGGTRELSISLLFEAYCPADMDVGTQQPSESA